MQSTFTDNQKSWLTEGVVIASVPLVGYLIAYSFQWGYSNYLGIPKELIGIDPPQIIRTTVGVVFVVLFSIFNELSLYALKKNILYYKMLNGGPIFVYFVTYFLIHKSFLATGLLVSSIIMLFLDWTIPVWAEKNEQGYITKLAVYEEKRRQKNMSQEALTFKAIQRFGYENIVLIVSLIILLFLVEISGEVYASKKRVFLTLSDNPNQVVVSMYDNKVICASLDRQTRTLGSVFKIYDLSPSTSFMADDVGPLKTSSID